MNWMLAILPLLLPLAAAPTSPGPETELNALGALNGTRPLDKAGEPSDDAMRMIDGSPATPWEPEREEGVNPAAVLQLAEPFDLTSLEAVNSDKERSWPGISIKKLRVELAASPQGPWKPLAELTLKKGTAPQRTKISARQARYLRVTLLENHGCAEWWSLGELRAFGTRSAPRGKVAFNGAWETGLGELRLDQTGERIVGCYGTGEKENGLYTVEGSLEGSVFSGIWREKTESGEASEGTMVFALTTEGDLSGVWNNSLESRVYDTRWDGKRKGAPTITCEKPEKSIGEELAKGRVVLRGILFDTGKATIKAESIPVLEALSAAIKKNPRSFAIEGHTDDRGGKDYNQKLSEQRAASVKAWLLESGLEAARLRPLGFGMSRPTMPNDSEAGRLQNRRVEVALDGK